MNKNNHTVSISHFYQVYAIPKRNLKEDFSRQLSPTVAAESFRYMYNELVLNHPDNANLGDVAFIVCDRFFEAKTGLKFDIGKQLEDLLVQKLQGSWPFTQEILKNQICVFETEELLTYDSESPLVYMDVEDQFYQNIDYDSEYFILPVFVICTNPDLHASNFLLKKLRNEELHNKVLNGLATSPINHLIKSRTNQDRYFMGVMENRELAAQFLIQARGLVRNLLQEK